MKRKKKLITPLAFPLSLLLLSCDNNSSNKEQESTIKAERITLLNTTKSWDGTPYPNYPQTKPEISVLKISIPPHQQLDWHKHPVINVAYVAKGEVLLEKKDDGKKIWVREGEAVPETVNLVHKGQTGDKGVTLIVFYAGTPGVPITEPE
ncbi:cupin domain-containing protein [Chryseobacterium tructae]|uniref:Cupin domain-containing protein n=1 Tax=Chryseobacterium tructae TaxID=1037380 RepID=A0ABV7Y2J2_9FLAO|nr:cupin domain-containing protein [Chryseobacterium tructae]MDN3693977.1 cupin domain-containing protein [Chryseobacterium tructae]